MVRANAYGVYGILKSVFRDGGPNDVLSAVRSPTADSTTGLSHLTSRPASWKPHTTAPTKPSNRSSICSLRDGHVANVIVGVFLSRMRQGRI